MGNSNGTSSLYLGLDCRIICAFNQLILNSIFLRTEEWNVQCPFLAVTKPKILDILLKQLVK
jgi:hypothetical protein